MTSTAWRGTPADARGARRRRRALRHGRPQRLRRLLWAVRGVISGAGKSDFISPYRPSHRHDPGERSLCARVRSPSHEFEALTAADKAAPRRRRRAAAQSAPPRCPRAQPCIAEPEAPGSELATATVATKHHGLGLGPARRLPPGHDLARGHPESTRVSVDADAAAKTSADAADTTRLHGRHRPPRPAARVARFYG